MSINKSIYEELILSQTIKKDLLIFEPEQLLFNILKIFFLRTITAKLKVVNTGNTMTSFKDDDGETQSIYNGLPLRGGERLSMKIAGNVPGRESLDFSQNSKNIFMSQVLQTSFQKVNKKVLLSIWFQEKQLQMKPQE